MAPTMDIHCRITSRKKRTKKAIKHNKMASLSVSLSVPQTIGKGPIKTAPPLLTLVFRIPRKMESRNASTMMMIPAKISIIPETPSISEMSIA